MRRGRCAGGSARGLCGAGGFVWVLAAGAGCTDWDVDVGGRSDTGEVTVSDTAVTDTVSPVSANSGKVTGLVQMVYSVCACPDCFGLADTLDASVQVAFHAPADGSWNDWLPAKGTWVENPESRSLATSFLDAGEQATLSTSTSAITLQRADDNVLEVEGLGSSDWEHNSSYDLDTSGGGDIGVLRVAGVAATPEGFDAVSPSSLLETEAAQAFSTRFSATTGTSIGWSPTGSGTMLLVVDTYDATGVYQNTWTWYDDDVGSVEVPASVFADQPAGSLVVVALYRHDVGGARRDDDGSTVESSVSFGFIGTGMVQ